MTKAPQEREEVKRGKPGSWEAERLRRLEEGEDRRQKTDDG